MVAGEADMRSYVLAGVIVAAGLLLMVFSRRRRGPKPDYVDSHVLSRINTEY
jgi:LPXTG-motif cell wall-anchored protein